VSHFTISPNYTADLTRLATRKRSMMDAALAEWSGEIAAEVLQPQADHGGEGAVRLARRPARDRHGIQQDGDGPCRG